MARFTRAKNATRSLAIAGRGSSKADATPRVARAFARNRSNRRLVQNRRRLHRRALRSGCVARGNSVRPRAPTSVALRTRTSLQARNPAETKTTLWRQNHSRPPLARWLKKAADPAVLLYSDRFFLLKLRQGNALRETKTGPES